MKKTKLLPALLLLVCSSVLVGGIMAASQAYLTREIFGSAGESTTDGNLYILNGTLGESIVSNFTVETNYGLGSGYWAEGIITAKKTIYLPLVLNIP